MQARVTAEQARRGHSVEERRLDTRGMIRDYQVATGEPRTNADAYFSPHPDERAVEIRTGVFNSTGFASRSKSRSSRARPFLQNGFARLIAGIAVAAVMFAAVGSIRGERERSVDAFLAASSQTTFAALRSIPSYAVAPASRSASRSTAFGPALPSLPEATRVSDIAHGVALPATKFSRASVARRGYDATAPPSLS
jgi:hypothetical protein